MPGDAALSIRRLLLPVVLHSRAQKLERARAGHERGTDRAPTSFSNCALSLRSPLDRPSPYGSGRKRESRRTQLLFVRAPSWLLTQPNGGSQTLLLKSEPLPCPSYLAHAPPRWMRHGMAVHERPRGLCDGSIHDVANLDVGQVPVRAISYLGVRWLQKVDFFQHAELNANENRCERSTPQLATVMPTCRWNA